MAYNSMFHNKRNRLFLLFLSWSMGLPYTKEECSRPVEGIVEGHLSRSCGIPDKTWLRFRPKTTTKVCILHVGRMAANLASFIHAWPWGTKEPMQHDSCNYNLYQHGKVSPFPTQHKQRPNNFFGFIISRNETLRRCPLECRPKDHKDWIYCWNTPKNKCFLPKFYHIAALAP